jgi:perosamine synthetase
MKIARTLPPVGYQPFLSDLLGVACRAISAQGHDVEALEREFVEHFSIRQAFAVSSGKAALTLILRALTALTGRRKVILPAYACYSIPSSIIKAGLDVIPCDIGKDSFDYDYDQLASMLEGDVLCVLSVHLFGIPSDTARLNELCRPKGIFVVEDATDRDNGRCGVFQLRTRQEHYLRIRGHGGHQIGGDRQ